MISKLRRKFLTITFISIFIVVSIIVGYINLFNYTNMQAKHKQIISNVLNNENQEGNSFENVIIRYTVIIEVSGDNITLKNGQIEDDLTSIATDILKLEDKTGKYNNYFYGYKDTIDGSLIVLSNNERDNALSTAFFYNSVIISLLGILFIYITLFFLSSYILKPFIKNEENQKQFITNASHELKTPITIINANLDVLKIDNINNEWTQSINTQTKRLELLVNNLINLSKVEEMNPNFIKTTFSLSDAIIEEVTSYIPLFKEKNINLSVNIQNNTSFNGDEKQIRDVIKLLLDNCMKYAKDKVEIYIENNTLYFANTSDLENNDYSFIFDRFSRIDTVRNQTINGYGIGLSIVKKILDNHQCDVSAYSTNNIFYIKIKL